MRTLIIFDDGTEVFLPNLFFVDYFKSFVNKKNKQLINSTLKQFLKNLTIDKKNNLYFLDFKELEQRVYNFIQSSDMIGYKKGFIHDRGVHWHKGKIRKSEISNHIRNYDSLKKKSRIISFYDILEFTSSRHSYLSFLDFNTTSIFEKVDQKILRKNLVLDNDFYLQIYKKKIGKEWLLTSKHKEVIVQFLFENSLKLLFDFNKSRYFEDKDFIFLLNQYLELKIHKKNYPIVTWEVQRKWFEESNQTILLNKKDTKIFFDEEKNHFEEYVNNTFFIVLKLYFNTYRKEIFNIQSSEIIKSAIINFLCFSFAAEKIDEQASFFFEEKEVLKFFNSIGEAASTEGLLFFSANFPDSLFVKELYKYLLQKNLIKLEDNTLLISKYNPELNKIILNKNWKKMTVLVCENYSNNSEFKKFFFKNLKDCLTDKELVDNFILSNEFNIEHKKDFLIIAKKSFLKKDFKKLSRFIYSQIDLVDNYILISPFFKLLHPDELLDIITKLGINNLNKLKERTTFFEDLIKLENSNNINKILGRLQLINFKLFDEELKILNSSNFRSAFVFNLENIDDINKKINLFESSYFFNFLLTTNGIKWLKSTNGQIWLDSKHSKKWRNSNKGKFISEILAENKSLKIDTQESFNLYLSILNSDNDQNINKSYLINHNPETFSYLLNTDHELIYSVDLNLFNFYSEFNKVILESSDVFFQNDEKITEISTKFLMSNGEVHKLKDAALFIDKHFINFYKFQQNWFISDDFETSYKKYKLDNLFKQVFNYNVGQHTTASKDILSKLASIDESLFFNLIKSTEITPLWLISEQYFIEILSRHFQDSVDYFNIIGKRFFPRAISGFLLNKQWFLEFITNFSKKHTNNLARDKHTQTIYSCHSGQCISTKTGKAKEGYKSFYDTLIAISHYFSYLRVINRPYQCPYTDLWHTTSQWN